jgi:hypothetical protein
MKLICPKGHDIQKCGRNTEYRCRLCANSDSRKWHTSKSKAALALMHRKSNLKKNYGLTLENYDNLFKFQSGYCLGCNRHQNQLNHKLNVDHNHITGKIRGLLCIGCNRALGFVEENRHTLINLANYLKENS